METVKAGVKGGAVNAAAESIFEKHGFVTERRNKDFVGFIHSVGHGLGLGASKSTKFKAVSSDREYLSAASKAIKKARK